MAYKFNPFTGNFDDFNGPNGEFTSIDVDGDITLDDGGSFTTTLQTITPTAARTISFPNATGTVALVGGSSGQLVYNNAGAYAGAPGSVVGATGDITLGLNGATGVPPVAVTGTWFVGTTPQVLIQPSNVGTAGAWSASGTAIGVNAVTGFAGRFLDLQINGTSEWNFSGTVFGIGEANDIAVGTTTGTKIGTATTQKLGFFNKTPVVQPIAVADATDAGTVITQLNALLARMRDLGLIAT